MNSAFHHHHYGHAAPGTGPHPDLVRDVWALVSRSPQLGMGAIGQKLGVSSSQVARALRFLRDAGYIDYEDRATATRRILVPLIEVTL